MFECNREIVRSRLAKGCVMCTNTNSSNVVNVLDSNLGVIQTVVLCNRHTPYENQMKYVYDIGSLVGCIQSKFKKRT